MAVVSCGNCNHDAGSFSEHAPILGADGRGLAAARAARRVTKPASVELPNGSNEGCAR